MTLHRHIKGKIRMYGPDVRLVTRPSGCYEEQIRFLDGTWVPVPGSCWDYFGNALASARKLEARLRGVS